MSFLTSAPLPAMVRRTLSRVTAVTRPMWHLFYAHPLAVMVVLAGIAHVVLLWRLHGSTTRLYRNMALQGSALQCQILSDLREAYTSEVVSRASRHGLLITHDYADKPDAIPLPATLTMELGRRTAASRPGADVRLYSEFPFPWRHGGGPRDEFERDAIGFLKQHPDQPFYRFEQYAGRPTLRYATADRMKDSCVACHNTHPDSPKRDWKAGDVRGVLEVIRPLDEAVAATRADVGRTFALALTISGLGLLGIAAVIRKLRRVARGMEQSEARIRNIMDNAAEGVITISERGVVELYNSAASRIFGYAPAEVIGQNVSMLMPLPVHQEHGYLARYVRTGERKVLGTRREVTGRRKDGTTFPLETHVSEAQYHGQRTFTGIVRDLTEPKRVDEQLRKLSRAVEQSPCSVVITDLKGDIEYVNPKFTQVTGYTSDEVIGKNPRLLKSGRISAEGYKQLWDTISSGREWHGEFENKKKNGESYWEFASISPIRNGDGAITHFVAVKEDITQRKHVEQQLQKYSAELERKVEELAALSRELETSRQQAESANRAKSEFLANMSHEIRTPMNGIIGMTELALDTKLAPEQREYVESVKNSADSLLTVINDILDFSKIEAGKLHLDCVDFNLHDCVIDAVKTLSFRAHQKCLELPCHILADVQESLCGDPARLRQIIINLVGNAIKFTGEGEVVVRVERDPEHAPSADHEIWLHFSVRDTGIGIPLEKQQAIFNPFEQADGSTTRKYGGTGLGLTISTKLVAIMGGRIWVESEPGRGSTFHFTARFCPAKSAVARNSRTRFVDLENLPVLVVDDNATNLRILDELLHKWRMRPRLVDGARDALAAMEQAANAGEPFPLVILDAQMPEMDGFELTQRVKANGRLAGATIIMLSSLCQLVDAARARQLGLAALLTKPYKQSELLDCIIEVMHKASAEESSTAGRPARDTDAGASVTHTAAARPLRVLLAEDNVVNQKVAVRTLEKRGHAVVVADNGKDAVAAIQNDHFDVVLMDVQMPEMDGFEATAAIRKIEERDGGHVPIIAMTAHAMKSDRERCLNAGMDDYVSKPIHARDLFDAMERLLGNETFRGEDASKHPMEAIPT